MFGGVSLLMWYVLWFLERLNGRIWEFMKTHYSEHFYYCNFTFKLQGHSFSCFILPILNEVTIHSKWTNITNGGYHGCVLWDGKRTLPIKRPSPYKCAMPFQITHILFTPPLKALLIHYIDVIMTTMASQITSLTVVYSTIYSEADQRRHQSSASLAFV